DQHEHDDRQGDVGSICGKQGVHLAVSDGLSASDAVYERRPQGFPESLATWWHGRRESLTSSEGGLRRWKSGRSRSPPYAVTTGGAQCFATPKQARIGTGTWLQMVATTDTLSKGRA